jgi:FAD:protein FMN transferase
MENVQLKFEAIGTKWVIDCFGLQITKKELLEKIKNRIEIFDKTYSRFRKDSLVWKISQNTGKYTFPSDSKKLFDLYGILYKITNGKFTLLIGNPLSQAGYDSSYSLVPKKINKVPEIDSVYSFEYPVLTIKKPYILDFGGLGKGYLIDIVCELLLKEGVDSFCIDAGGDILCHNLKDKLRIGLENPKNFKQVIGVIEFLNGSLCASAGSRRKWDKFHHILDPKTLSSPKDIFATWVMAKETVIADGLATCLFLVPPGKLIKYFNFEYLVLYSDFRIDKSLNFPAEIFYKS